MTTIQTELDKLIEAQRQLKQEFQTKAQGLFKSVTKEFFNKNPAITMITWTQYTPYFNDGEECVFSVYEPSFTNCPIDEKDDISRWGEYEGENEDVWAVTNPAYIIKSGGIQYTKEKSALTALAESKQIDIASMEAFSNMIQSPEMKDVMRAMFEDHVTIIATREGFDVEEFEHD